MTDISFKNLFFRYYDSKICDGSITFGKLGISKMDFTRICTEDNFVFDDETLQRLCQVMNLTEEQKAEFLETAAKTKAGE